MLLPLHYPQTGSPYKKVETKSQTDDRSNGIEPVFTVVRQGSFMLICDQCPNSKDEKDEGECKTRSLSPE